MSVVHCFIFLLLWSQNSLIKGVYPASPSSWLFVVIAILANMYMSSDPSMGLITKIQEHLPLRYASIKLNVVCLKPTIVLSRYNTYKYPNIQYPKKYVFARGGPTFNSCGHNSLLKISRVPGYRPCALR